MFLAKIPVRLNKSSTLVELSSKSGTKSGTSKRVNHGLS